MELFPDPRPHARTHERTLAHTHTHIHTQTNTHWQMLIKIEFQTDDNKISESVFTFLKKMMNGSFKKSSIIKINIEKCRVCVCVCVCVCGEGGRRDPKSYMAIYEIMKLIESPLKA